jgi:sigma-B regulation protein RsbU (phosphoserine phosphatase)
VPFEGIIVVIAVFALVGKSGSVFNSPVPVTTIAMGSGIAGMVIFRRVNKVIMPSLDRRFFREALDLRRILLELYSRISSLHDRSAILQATAAAIDRALHPHSIRIWHLCDDSSFAFAADASLPADETLGSLDKEHRYVRKMLEGGAYVESPPAVDSDDSGQCELWIPLRGKTSLIGFMGLGAKLSEEPYSSEDRDLLITVSRHVGMALENAELLEVARREAEFSRDMKIAREVQQRLFPSSLPEVPGWKFAGSCVPAGHVGGDYYDIFEIDSDMIVLSLGDVSGKGLGASFTMSSVHAAIRTRRNVLLQDPAAALQELNKYLAGSTAPGTFVTLFLAVVDTRSGVVRYTNCGHPRPSVSGVLQINLETAHALDVSGHSISSRRNVSEQGDDTIYSDGVIEPPIRQGSVR